MQALINRYARLIVDALTNSDAEFPKKLILYMKSRGHLSLLTAAVQKAERLSVSQSHTTVTVASAPDAKKFAAHIASTVESLGVAKEEYTIRVDDRAVGGYAVLAHNQLVDRTYRSALVSLYQHSI
jgi:F0F1-type ATP synthase delta subunit